MIPLETEWREAQALVTAAPPSWAPPFGLARIKPIPGSILYRPDPAGFWAVLVRPSCRDLVAFNFAGEWWQRIGNAQTLGERDGIAPMVWPTPADWFLNEGRGMCWL